jgi:hypothetical protein
MKIYLNGNLRRDWLAIQRSRPEAPPVDRFHCLFV